MNPTFIQSITTATPEFEFDQGDAIQVLRKTYGDRFPEIDRYFSSFGNTLIEKRYSAVPLEWFYGDHGWKDRSSVFKTAAINLLKKTTLSNLAENSLNAKEIDAIITVSTTGVVTPSLESHLMDFIPFRDDVFRIPVFGWGCAGGVLGLILGQQLLQNQNIKNVLILSVELCTLCFCKEALTPKDIISTSLFSDGAAAVLLSREKEQGLELGGYLKHRWPDSISLMGWEVQDQGFNVIFSQKIPEIVKNQYPEILDRFLAKNQQSLKAFDHFVAHPGGPRIIEYLENIYALPSGSMTETRSVLNKFGNMSSPTVLFALDDFMKSSKKGRVLISTLGPGFTCAVLEAKKV